MSTRALNDKTAGRLAFGGISGSYTALSPLGSSAVADVVRLRLDNATDIELTFSYDAGTTDHIYLGPGRFEVIDFGSNGTAATITLHVKQTGGVAATSGFAQASVVRRA